METLNTTASTEFQPLELHDDKIFGRVNKLIKEKNFKEALPIVEEYMPSQYKYSSFLNLAAEVYRSIMDYTNEEICLNKLVDLDPKPRHLILLAECLIKQDDFPKAIKFLHGILDETDGKDPILFEVYKNMGNIYMKCGDIDAAEESYNKANAINNQDENLIVNYGVLAIHRGQYDEAKKRFSSVLGMNKHSDLAWVGIALVHRSHGDLDLSRACLLRGLDENPYNKLAISNYYQWCDQDGVDATDEIIEHYIVNFPNDQEMSQLMSRISQ